VILSVKEDDIKAYVNKNVRIGSLFALGLPITIFDLISEWAAHFRK
jgi:hypothetical protein